MDGNTVETRRGRPRKDFDPQNTGALFLSDNSVNPDIADSYDDFMENEGDEGGAGEVPPGAGGVVEYSDDGLVKELWRRGHDKTVPAAAQINALIKCGQLRERLSARDTTGEIGSELAAFIGVIRAERVQ